MGAGCVFGEMALLTGQARTSTVVTTTKTIVHEIAKNDILPFIKKEPDILNQLSEILTQRTVNDEKQLKSRVMMESEKRSVFEALSKKIHNFFGLTESSSA